MSIGEFHALPRHYAWKHEYWEGTAHIRPRELAVVAALPLHILPEPSRTPPAGLVLAPLTDAAPEALAQLYRTAFRDTTAEGATELLTTYHPANEPSVAWHTQQGFIPLPCLSLTRLKLHAARSNGEETALLQAEVEHLEAQAEREGYESVEPILRLH